MLGCTRDLYHLEADHDAYHTLQEKTAARPWELPYDYSVIPDPSSRMFDHSDPNDPALPYPGPNLYSYRLPNVATPATESAPPIESLPAPAPHSAPLERPQNAEASSRRNAGSNAQSNSLRVREVSVQEPPSITPAEDPQGADRQIYADADEGLTIQPIPAEYWDALPRGCLSRMLEFESVREEYRRTFSTEPPADLRDQSPKLAFDNIVELAYLNSREYQAQKEILYSAALALTLQRFDYMTKFSAFGNGVDVNYDHFRADGVTTNTLSTPSSLRADKMVALGGTVVAQFANNILLTFNGPSGFAEDINSTLLFDFTQSVFQRDVLFEPLIQTERNVVYAARNFARFRKQFYFNLALTYYQDLLGTYRGIEIDTQNYFAFVRALDQAEAEVRSGVGNAQPRFQIDQIEQNMLAGRSRLISTCNNLETSLDRLKLTLGIPTETPVNIDLRELERLTRRDEIEVVGELIRRAKKRLEGDLGAPRPDREEILSSAIVLLERVLNWLDLQEQLGAPLTDTANLRAVLARLRVDEAYEALDRARSELDSLERSAQPTAPINLFRGAMSSVGARLALVARQLQLADLLARDATTGRDEVLRQFADFKGRTEAIRSRASVFLRGEGEDLKQLQLDAKTLLAELVGIEAAARRMIAAPAARAAREAELQSTMQQANGLLDRTDQLSSSEQGLSPVEISVDDAMVTALVQRFELMNQRSFLADDWRGIKLAADDLKSVLNLNVRQTLRTEKNRPFGFSFDNSQTELSASFDLPLNRRQQRNQFRQALIDYQAGRRGLMALEDNIKFSARQDLRQLSLDSEQYGISVISAALASERVYSTQLELSLGLATVTARDFLEAQQAYRAGLTGVANGRLAYIVNRARLAFDLEVMMLDDEGFWPELNNEDYAPKFDPVFPANAEPTYGQLPHGIWPSKQLIRMLHAPAPGYRVIGDSPTAGYYDGSGAGSAGGEAAPEELPIPSQ